MVLKAILILCVVIILLQCLSSIVFICALTTIEEKLERESK